MLKKKKKFKMNIFEIDFIFKGVKELNILKSLFNKRKYRWLLNFSINKDFLGIRVIKDIMKEEKKC